MKIFVAIVLLIATVAALPLETAERATEAVAAHPEGEASDALRGWADAIEMIDTAPIMVLSDKVGAFEDNVGYAIEGLNVLIADVVAP